MRHRGEGPASPAPTGLPDRQPREAERLTAPAAWPGLVLPDTNVWIDFARDRHASLRELLRADRVVAHETVVGELALGCGPQIARLADYVATLPPIGGLTATQVRAFVRQFDISCSGIGWCDACLLAECATTAGRVRLMTSDQNLRKAAERLGISYG